MTVPKKETLTQIFLKNHPEYKMLPLHLKDYIESVREWLKKERERLFIPTVSTMDCEMSGAVDDTFEELLENL